MSRDLISSLVDALGDDQFEPFFAVDLMFDSPSQLYMWTGVGNQTIDSKLYVGTGNLLGISMVRETSDTAARGATLSLSGVPPSIVSLALTEPYQGRLAKIYFGIASDPTNYTEIFSGFMDQMDIEEGPDSGTISLSIENKLIELERPRIRKYTSAFQKARFLNDKGLDFVASMQDQKLAWGSEYEGGGSVVGGGKPSTALEPGGQ